MALTQPQLDRVAAAAASARRAAGATQEEMQASLDFVVAAANGEGVRTLHRPAGALPGETGTFAELANGNRVIRFTGYAAAGKISMYGFTLYAGE